jgi:hypothetical protein
MIAGTRSAEIINLAIEREKRKPQVLAEKTGFLATLTPEQRERALDYRGDDNHGSPSLPKRRSSRKTIAASLLDIPPIPRSDK